MFPICRGSSQANLLFCILRHVLSQVVSLGVWDISCIHIPRCILLTVGYRENTTQSEKPPSLVGRRSFPFASEVVLLALKVSVSVTPCDHGIDLFWQWLKNKQSFEYIYIYGCSSFCWACFILMNDYCSSGLDDSWWKRIEIQSTGIRLLTVRSYPFEQK